MKKLTARTSSFLGRSALAVSLSVVAALGASALVRTAGAQPNNPKPLTASPPLATVSANLSCAGGIAYDVEVERSRDSRLEMSKLLGATSWTTNWALTGKVTIVERVPRLCNTQGAPMTLSITADDPDARSALQTCALMAASLQAGQKLKLGYHGLEPARSGASGSLLLTKPQTIGCRIE